jgi:hypothetical protein
MIQKYLMFLLVILGAIAVYGIISLQWMVMALLMLGAVWIAACVFFIGSLRSRPHERKRLALFLIAISVTLYGFFTKQWLFWGVVITLLMADYLIDDIREWMDGRQERFLATLREIHAGHIPADQPAGPSDTGKDSGPEYGN